MLEKLENETPNETKYKISDDLTATICGGKHDWGVVIEDVLQHKYVAIFKKEIDGLQEVLAEAQRIFAQ